VPSPNLGNGDNVLYAAVALRSRSVVAVGNWLNGSDADTLSQQWDGTMWRIAPSPSPGGYLNFLTGVAALGSNDVWAVGWASGQPFGATRTLAEHWDGTTWSLGRTTDVGSESNALTMVARIPGARRFWAVGHFEKNSVDNTLIESAC
jgi:hypothetical protein